jgi:hypothetical protein
MQPIMSRTSSTSKAIEHYDSEADIAELRKLLSERHADSRKQRFRNMYDTIQLLTAAGISNAAIIKKLKAMGLSVAPVTFKNWLAEIQQELASEAVGDQTETCVSQVRDAMRRATEQA